MAVDGKEVNVHMTADSDIQTEEHYFCSVALQVTIPTWLPATVLVNCHGPGLMIIETHRNFVKLQCSMTVQGLMDILSGKLLYVYNADLTAEPVNWLKFMIVQQHLMLCYA